MTTTDKGTHLGTKIMMGLFAGVIGIIILSAICSSKNRGDTSSADSGAASVDETKLKPYSGVFVFTGQLKGVLSLRSWGSYELKFGDGGSTDTGTWDLDGGTLILKSGREAAPLKLTPVSHDELHESSMGVTFHRIQ